MIERLLPYYLDCLDAEGGWRVRVPLRARAPRFLVPPLTADWNVTGPPRLDIRLDRRIEPLLKELQQRKTSLSLFYGWPLLVVAPAGKAPMLVPALLQPVEWQREDDLLRLDLVQETPHLNEELANEICPTAEERMALLAELDLESWGRMGPAAWMRRAGEILQAGIGGRGRAVLDPDALSQGPDAPPIAEAGLHNRAVVAVAEKPRFTLGLEEELRLMARTAPTGAWRGTALRRIFAARNEPVPTAVPRVRPRGHLVEVVPLNREQKAAVSAAFNRDFTVITGPPGTGKSQVVVAILANAFLRGERVLFTSRNHKAVSVVEERLNRIAGAPIVVRVGGRQGERDFRRDLGDFIGRILSAGPSPDRRRQAEEARRRFQELQDRYTDLRRRQATGESTPSLTSAAFEIEDLRSRLGQQRLTALVEAGRAGLPSSVLGLSEVVAGHAGKRTPWFPWGAEAKARRRDAQAVETAVYPYRRHPVAFGPLPDPLPRTGDWSAWIEPAARLADCYRIAGRAVGLVRRAASEVASAPAALSAEALELEIQHVALEMAEAGMRLIATRVESLPDTIDGERRRVLAEFKAIVERLADGEVPARVRAGLHADLARLMPQVSAILPIWCVTNLSVRSLLPFQPGLFDMVVIDEASQCDVPSALPVLYRGARAVVIGDPNQLRHVSTMGPTKSHEIEVRHRLDTAELQARAYDRVSLFDAAALAVDEQPVMLREHFRSHPEIIAFSNSFWYAGRLEVRTDVNHLRHPVGIGPGLVFVDAPGPVEKARFGGAMSMSEAKATVEWAERIAKDRSFHGTLGIVTPFRAQATLISEMLKDRLDLATLERLDLIVDTAHGFQGDERDVVIFSPCVGEDMPDGSRIFLSRTSNLFNVALTRARSTLVVVGDRASMLLSRIEHVQRFARHVAPPPVATPSGTG